MNCKICDRKTDVLFEIRREDHPICSGCATAIFLAQAKAYAKNQTVFDIGGKKERIPVQVHPETSASVLNYLYGDLLKQRNDFTPDNIPKAYLQFISARINEGHTVDELKAVAYLKYKEWKDTDNAIFVRADTLYRPKNFERYLSEVEVKKPQWKVVNTKEQKAIIRELNSYGVRGERNDETDKLAKRLMQTGYARKEFLNLYLKDRI